MKRKRSPHGRCGLARSSAFPDAERSGATAQAFEPPRSERPGLDGGAPGLGADAGIAVAPLSARRHASA